MSKKFLLIAVFAGLVICIVIFGYLKEKTNYEREITGDEIMLKVLDASKDVRNYSYYGNISLEYSDMNLSFNFPVRREIDLKNRKAFTLLGPKNDPDSFYYLTDNTEYLLIIDFWGKAKSMDSQKVDKWSNTLKLLLECPRPSDSREVDEVWNGTQMHNQIKELSGDTKFELIGEEEVNNEDCWIIRATLETKNVSEYLKEKLGLYVFMTLGNGTTNLEYHISKKTNNIISEHITQAIDTEEYKNMYIELYGVYDYMKPQTKYEEIKDLIESAESRKIKCDGYCYGTGFHISSCSLRNLSVSATSVVIDVHARLKINNWNRLDKTSEIKVKINSTINKTVTVFLEVRSPTNETFYQDFKDIYLREGTNEINFSYELLCNSAIPPYNIPLGNYTAFVKFMACGCPPMRAESKFEVTVKPDLIPISLTTIPYDNGVEGEDITINSIIQNLDYGDSGNFSVKFYLDPRVCLPPGGYCPPDFSHSKLLFATTMNLSAGEFKELSFNTNLTFGSHSIYLVLDEENKVNETNEENNVISTGIWVDLPNLIKLKEMWTINHSESEYPCGILDMNDKFILYSICKYIDYTGYKKWIRMIDINGKEKWTFNYDINMTSDPYKYLVGGVIEDDYVTICEIGNNTLTVNLLDLNGNLRWKKSVDGVCSSEGRLFGKFKVYAKKDLIVVWVCDKIFAFDISGKLKWQHKITIDASEEIFDVCATDKYIVYQIHPQLKFSPSKVYLLSVDTGGIKSVREYTDNVKINCQENKILLSLAEGGWPYSMEYISALDENLIEKPIAIFNFSELDIPVDCRFQSHIFIVKDYIVGDDCALYLNGTLKWTQRWIPSMGDVRSEGRQYKYPSKYKVMIFDSVVRLLNLDTGVYDINMEGYNAYLFGKYLVVMHDEKSTLYKLPS